MSNIFTSESVFNGHPDKVADIISSAIVDAYLSIDSSSHVACEVLVTADTVILAGEVKSSVIISNEEIELIVRKTINSIGYTTYDENSKFSGNKVKIINYLHEQSSDIDMGVTLKNNIGAGDQGILMGFACRDTKEMLPYPIYYATRLSNEFSRAISSGLFIVGPDGKCQVTYDYDKDQITDLVLSVQHPEYLDIDTLRNQLKQFLLDNNERLFDNKLTNKTNILINPTGKFVIGGPNGDTGLTNRKIAADTYGGFSSIGGGGKFGKDPTKVDFSGAVMTRKVAKELLTENKELYSVFIQVGYAIGVADPVSIIVKTSLDKNNILIYNEKLTEKLIKEKYRFSPKNMIEELSLLKPNYTRYAKQGLFINQENSWELI